MNKIVVFLMHAGYWFLYLLLLFLMLLAVHVKQMNHVATVPAVLQLMFFSPFSVILIFTAVTGFYFNYLYVFKRFLQKKKFVELVVNEVIFALNITIVGEIFIHWNFPEMIDNWEGFIGLGIIMMFLMLLHGATALVMRGFISWYNDIRVKEELKRRQFETELDLLKSQINPHFLFNTLNNIDVLIAKDAARASAYLNKLSGILRFMLYETRTEKIPLSKEIAYIEKYLDLQKIRTTNPDYIHFTVTGNTSREILVEPLLFIPFIENAFKHSEGRKKDKTISIAFEIQADKVIFTCMNYFEPLQQKPDHSGLGNELISKRLMLLYHDKHELKIKKDDGIYSVTLVIPI